MLMRQKLKTRIRLYPCSWTVKLCLLGGLKPRSGSNTNNAWKQNPPIKNERSS